MDDDGPGGGGDVVFAVAEDAAGWTVLAGLVGGLLGALVTGGVVAAVVGARASTTVPMTHTAICSHRSHRAWPALMPSTSRSFRWRRPRQQPIRRRRCCCVMRSTMRWYWLRAMG